MATSLKVNRSVKMTIKSSIPASDTPDFKHQLLFIRLRAITIPIPVSSCYCIVEGDSSFFNNIQ